MNSSLRLFLACMSIFLLVTCKKEEEETPNKYAVESLVIPKDLPDYDGFFLAIRDMVGIDVTGTQEIGIDAVIARIGKPTFVDVGTVKLNNKVLYKTPSFQYSSDLENLIFDLTPGKQNKWSIEGGNGFAAFEKTLSIKMPQKVNLLNPPATISRQSEITLKLKEVPNNSQSIIWTIKDVEGKELYKETTTAEVRFSAAELQTLTTGKNSLIKIVAYNLETYSHSGKNYVFINETVETADIDLVP